MWLRHLDIAEFTLLVNAGANGDSWRRDGRFFNMTLVIL
jgi:hypothetical protein